MVANQSAGYGCEVPKRLPHVEPFVTTMVIIGSGQL